jgi:hypothetical protein
MGGCDSTKSHCQLQCCVNQTICPAFRVFLVGYINKTSHHHSPRSPCIFQKSSSAPSPSSSQSTASNACSPSACNLSRPVRLSRNPDSLNAFNNMANPSVSYAVRTYHDQKHSSSSQPFCSLSGQPGAPSHCTLYNGRMRRQRSACCGTAREIRATDAEQDPIHFPHLPARAAGDLARVVAQVRGDCKVVIRSRYTSSPRPSRTHPRGC